VFDTLPVDEIFGKSFVGRREKCTVGTRFS
jgi:hypothetical protein